MAHYRVSVEVLVHAADRDEALDIVTAYVSGWRDTEAPCFVTANVQRELHAALANEEDVGENCAQCWIEKED